jgi:hypothetical protein
VIYRTFLIIRDECRNPDWEIGTTDSADFADFEEVLGDARTNFFVAKLQGVANHNLLYLGNLAALIENHAADAEKFSWVTRLLDPKL